MSGLFTVLIALLTAFAVPAFAQAPLQILRPHEYLLVIELKTGKVTVQLRPDLAPKHVERVKQLAREGFYNGLKFHRVIAGFMAQTGDPTGTGSGGSKYPDLPAEFTRRRSSGHRRCGAHQQSQQRQQPVLLQLHAHPHLNGQYTVWGKVIDGMTHIDNIKKARAGPRARSPIRT